MEPQLYHCLDFIFWHVDMLSKIFLQSVEEIQIQQHQVRVWWVIQDSETKASKLYSCSHTFVHVSIVMLQNSLLHMRTDLSKLCFKLSICFTAQLRVGQ
jgi:hypothetical protein